MCYAKPGPRCSPHAREALQRAKQTGNKDAIKYAQNDYDETKDGRDELQYLINTTKNPMHRVHYATRLSLAVARRADKMDLFNKIQERKKDVENLQDELPISDLHRALALNKNQLINSSKTCVKESELVNKAGRKVEAVSAEEKVRSLFVTGEYVAFDNKAYEIVFCSKPTVNGTKGGEPKTDIFLRLKDSQGSIKDITISYKFANADFIENKLSEERAKSILGDEYKSILASAHQKLQLDKREFISKDGNAYTLGYRLDIMTKMHKSYYAVKLNPEQLRNIYAGTNLTENKKDAYVPEAGKAIKNSGIAQYMLKGNSFSSAQQVLNSVISIDDYVKNNPDAYLAFKAVNYRLDKDKWDGDRPLAFSIDWSKDGQGKISGKIRQPEESYATRANKQGEGLKQLMS